MLYEGELTKKIFPGVLDNYLLNQSLINIVRNFNYSIIEEIPSEIWEGRVEEAVRNYGEEQVREWMAALSNLPLDLELLWKFRSVNLDDIQHLKLPKNIEKIDVCDLTGDGSEDILISSDRLLSLIDGKTFKELALIDAETWKYENDFNREFKENYTKVWFDSDYLAICANSPKENASYLFLYTWEKYKLVKKKGSNYEVEWKKSVKNFRREWTRKIEDIDGDGIDDLIIGFWREERPEIVKFLGLKYHLGTEGTAEGGEFSWKLNIGDLNGDGANESVVVYHDDEGCNIKIFSRFYKFEYRAFREFWEIWNKYHYLMPIENVGDLNGDGSDDIAIGIVNKGEKGAKIIFMDVKNNKKIKTIDLERSEKEFDPREWIYVNDIARNKDVLAVSLSTLEWENENPKVVFYNLTDNKIVAVLYEDARRILKYKDGFVIITTEGKIIPISTYGNLNVTVETEGGEVRVRWNKNGYARVYVNGILAASLRGKEARIRLDNGNYEIKVALLDDEGYEIYGYGNVKVFRVSNLSFLNIILALIIISLAAIRFWVRK